MKKGKVTCIITCSNIYIPCIKCSYSHKSRADGHGNIQHQEMQISYLSFEGVLKKKCSCLYLFVLFDFCSMIYYFIQSKLTYSTCLARVFKDEWVEKWKNKNECCKCRVRSVLLCWVLTVDMCIEINSAITLLFLIIVWYRIWFQFLLCPKNVIKLLQRC